MNDLAELERIVNAVRKDLKDTLGDWRWHEWSRRFAEGLLARGVTVSPVASAQDLAS